MYIYDNISLKSAYNKNVSNKLCARYHNTHLAFNNFSPQNCAFYEIMRKNALQPDRPQMTI